MSLDIPEAQQRALAFLAGSARRGYVGSLEDLRSDAERAGHAPADIKAVIRLWAENLRFKYPQAQAMFTGKRTRILGGSRPMSSQEDELLMKDGNQLRKLGSIGGGGILGTVLIVSLIVIGFVLIDIQHYTGPTILFVPTLLLILGLGYAIGPFLYCLAAVSAGDRLRILSQDRLGAYSVRLLQEWGWDDFSRPIQLRFEGLNSHRQALVTLHQRHGKVDRVVLRDPKGFAGQIYDDIHCPAALRWLALRTDFLDVRNVTLKPMTRHDLVKRLAGLPDKVNR